MLVDNPLESNLPSSEGTSLSDLHYLRSFAMVMIGFCADRQDSCLFSSSYVVRDLHAAVTS
jgi:hypothetical protein